MDSTSVGILNQLLGQYSTAAGQMEGTAIGFAKEIFNCLVLISFGVWFIRRLINRNSDQVETNIELVKLIIYMNVFYLLITSYDQFLPLIVQSFKAAGIAMGQNTANFIVVSNPGNVMNTGVSICTKLLALGAQHVLRIDVIGALLAWSTALLVLFCFVGIALEVLLIEIGSRLILTVGIIMLAFAGSEWTRDYATKYIHTFFIIGLKMLFIYLIVGMGGGLTATWVNTLNNVTTGTQVIPAYIAVMVASYTYWVLVTKLPDQAVGYLAGGSGINFGQNNVGLTAAAAAGGLAVSGYNFARAKITQKVTAMAGEKLAKDTATAFAKQELSAGGEKPTGKQINDFVTKTMGEAKRSVKEEQWSSKVSKTNEGQVAQKIQAAMEKAAQARAAQPEKINK